VKPLPRYGDISIFKDGVRRHVGFLKFEILTLGGLKRVELRHRSKVGRNWSNCGRDGDFRFFKMATAAILDFSKFKFSRGPNCVGVPNLTEIGQTVAEIWRFFSIFQDGGRPPSNSIRCVCVRTGTSQLVTRSTRHTVKWCDELTVVSDGVVTS